MKSHKAQLSRFKFNSIHKNSFAYTLYFVLHSCLPFKNDNKFSKRAHKLDRKFIIGAKVKMGNKPSFRFK